MLFRSNSFRKPDNFNPRSREGSDFFAFSVISSINIFQSTLPRRERREYHACSVLYVHISIHAPAKGATRTPAALPLTPIHFNPRSREGSDNLSAGNTNYPADFNPRSREGSDQYMLCQCAHTIRISISSFTIL